MTQPNPLLESQVLPPFSAIQPEHIQPAVEQAIAHCKSVIEQTLASTSEHTWESLVEPLENADDALSQLWSPVSHMNSVVNSPELREAHDACLPLRSEYGTFVGQHQGLFSAYDAFSKSDTYGTLSQAQKQVIDNSLRDFRLSGIDLEPKQQARYAEVKARLSELSSTFSNNLLDATNAWQKHVTDVNELAGLPESAIAAAEQAAQLKELDGYLLTLEFPSYIAVMTYADSAELRREIYTAFCTRASDQGPNAEQWNNSAIMKEQVALRQELAALLGFDNYAELSLSTKMAESPEQVLRFLNDLARRSKPQAEQEIAELTAFATQTHGVTELNVWDLTYYAEKLKQARYAINDEQLRPYFPEQRVLSGMFEVVSRLFGIRIEEQQDFDRWHNDVRFFTIYDADNQQRGSFYLDLYAREHKRGGAWMDECRVRRTTPAGLQLPVAYLTCNFNKPVGDKPALFTHDEVVTMFHEFGHGLHHMLTQIDVAGVSGINGVAWDAVELPSQFLENWCWQPEALAFISGHYDTNEPLPQDMLQRLLDGRNFQSALGMMRQLEFSLFDFELHQSGGDIAEVLASVRERVAVIEPAPFNRFQNSFGHIFAGGYSAGYYSYKWAEVLSADAFDKFESDGIFNAQTGRAFLTCVLEKGGSEAPMDLFKAFRGREPDIQPLLRHSGIQAA
ncbi:oligopeptidase A [Echinimonas agarilytica]|uniref:oligopeptidase A n=1 Tax=Echinimonas agarilytica TaxID=1215918 RepID=A0AA41W8N2_9GAMM|nr:oligopeptidase A [Echinimonas agarilytica]MCM2681065.1 oligopeptidase A [Echinimonas agarilytica]